MKRWVFFLTVLILTLFAKGQKNYATSSVLSTGKWIKVRTEGEGIFKVTASFLTKAGFTAPISSASIRLYGNGGAILPEANHLPAPDDLLENQIELFDGGDGLFDGQDYFLFYAPGENQWVYNVNSQKFDFLKNYYSDLSFYFIQVGVGSGSRLKEKIVNGNPVQEVKSFVDHIRFERDSFNFLNSGREWFGETFGNGYPVSRIFQVASDGVLLGTRFEFTSEVVGRSFVNPNKMTVSLNGNPLFQHSTPASIGTLLEPIANVSRLSKEGVTSGTAIAIGYDFASGNVSGQSWLNWFDIVFRRTLTQRNDTILAFRDPSIVSSNQLVSYHITSSNPNLKVWEVTKRGEYNTLKTEFLSSSHRFIDDASVFKEYISFDPALSKQPVLVDKVDNQNLHGEGFYDMVVVTHSTFLQDARRLAQFRQSNNGLRVLVVDVERIYNEFSSGSPDPSAIRNFLKMLYDRAGNNTANRPKYLLLFGGTSYQFKEKAGERKNLVPSYQSPSSLDPLTSYISDDYFGYLDNDDDINTNIPAPLLDVAVGRIPVRTVTQAKIAVDKIINYQSKSDFGPWRNEITLVADDEDFDLHFQDAEAHAALIESKQSV
ncbi:MAG: type secretion system sortase PorU, partial [Bacteroidota bacterium]